MIAELESKIHTLHQEITEGRLMEEALSQLACGFLWQLIVLKKDIS